MKNKLFIIFVVLIIASVAAIAAILSRKPTTAAEQPLTTPPATAAEKPETQQPKPAAPVTTETMPTPASSNGPDIFNQRPPHFAIRPTQPDELKKYFAEREEMRPESALLPEAYDSDQIARDPDYYKRVDPSRVYQTSNKVHYNQLPKLKPVSDVHHIVATYRPQAAVDSQVVIEVIATPGKPVTFYAPQNGTFENGKFSVTVKADENGRARQVFTVTEEPGYFPVHVHCPENKGIITFHIDSISPDEYRKRKQQ